MLPSVWAGSLGGLKGWWRSWEGLLGMWNQWWLVGHLILSHSDRIRIPPSILARYILGPKTACNNSYNYQDNQCSEQIIKSSILIMIG